MTPEAMIQQCRLSGVIVHLEGNLLKLKGSPDAVRVAVSNLKPYKSAILKLLTENQLLSQFRFDLLQSDIEAGCPAGELYRVNNMAWEFMEVDGMGFQEAIKAAAEIVANTEAAACETAYSDVMTLFLRKSKLGGLTHA